MLKPTPKLPDPPRKPPKRMLEQIEEVEDAVLHGAVEVCVTYAMELIEHHLGERWLRCLPVHHCVPARGARATVKAAAIDSCRSLPPVGASAGPAPELDSEQCKRLSEGRTVITHTTSSDGTNVGLAAQRVRAPAALVWETLNDFAHWHGMVDHCVGSEVYETRGEDVLLEGEVKAKVTVGVAWVRIAAHCTHVVDRAAGRLSWNLDRSKANDVIVNEGFWEVRPDPTDEEACIVYYSGVVVLAEWAPGWLNKFICEQGLPKAVGWIKREGERRYTAA